MDDAGGGVPVCGIYGGHRRRVPHSGFAVVQDDIDIFFGATSVLGQGWEWNLGLDPCAFDYCVDEI